MNQYIILGLAVLFLGLIGITTYFYTQNKKLKTANELFFNNNKAYELEVNGLKDSLSGERGVFQLTLKDIQTSQDKTIQELNKAKEQLGIKDNTIKEMNHFIANIHTDTTVVMPNNLVKDSCNFEVTIKYNPQTIFYISNKHFNGVDSLTHKADISASFSGFIYTKNIWKEPNFFKRLFLFKWGKYHTERTQLISDNNKITIKDFKVIKLIDK